MQHDSSGAAVLRLVREAVALHDAPLAPPPYQLNDDGQWQAVSDPAHLPTARGEGAPPRPFPCRAVETGCQAPSKPAVTHLHERRRWGYLAAQRCRACRGTAAEHLRARPK